MEQKTYSIEQVLNAKINTKAKEKIGELSIQLLEAQAKADLLQELYNNAESELNQLKAQLEAPVEVVEGEVVDIKPNRNQRRRMEKQRRQAQEKNDK